MAIPRLMGGSSGGWKERGAQGLLAMGRAAGRLAGAVPDYMKDPGFYGRGLRNMWQATGIPGAIRGAGEYAADRLIPMPQGKPAGGDIQYGLEKEHPSMGGYIAQNTEGTLPGQVGAGVGNYVSQMEESGVPVPRLLMGQSGGEPMGPPDFMGPRAPAAGAAGGPATGTTEMEPDVKDLAPGEVWIPGRGRMRASDVRGNGSGLDVVPAMLLQPGSVGPYYRQVSDEERADFRARTKMRQGPGSIESKERKVARLQDYQYRLGMKQQKAARQDALREDMQRHERNLAGIEQAGKLAIEDKRAEAAQAQIMRKLQENLGDAQKRLIAWRSTDEYAALDPTVAKALEDRYEWYVTYANKRQGTSRDDKRWMKKHGDTLKKVEQELLHYGLG